MSEINGVTLQSSVRNGSTLILRNQVLNLTLHTVTMILTGNCNVDDPAIKTEVKL